MTSDTARGPLDAVAAALIGATLLAMVALTGAIAPSALAGSSALAGPTLTVARGTTSAQTSGWRFSESYAGEFPASGFAIVIRIRPGSGSPDGISFVQSSPPVFDGPSSLDGSASFTDPRTLRIQLLTSNPGQVESFAVTGLRLAASETCGLGPIVVSYVTEGFAGSFGPLPSIATAGGAPTPTPSPAPSASPGPSPTPTATPATVATTTVAARVAAGSAGAYTTSFRTVITASPGGRVTVRATVRPVDAGRTVALYRRYGTSGPWRYVMTSTVDRSGFATVATRATLPAGWTGGREIRYRWLAPATATASAAWSDVARVVVR